MGALRIPAPLDFVVRDDKKLVSDALGAIQESVELHLAANRLVLGPAQVTSLRTTHFPAVVGNWVSHYATGAGTPLSLAMIGMVANSVDSIADCFKYDCTCSGAPRRRYYKNMESKGCGC